MEISAALAADLGILAAALDEPGADLLHSLHQLGVDALAAVPAYLGLSVTVDGSEPPYTFSTFADGAAGNVRTSLRLTPPADVHDGRVAPSVALILYAATPGAFVDLSADLVWLTGRPPSDFALDQHLSVPAGPDAATYLRTTSVINQAIGVLIGRGYAPRQAHSTVGNEACGTRTDRNAAAQIILDSLAAADRTHVERTDQGPHMG